MILLSNFVNAFRDLVWAVYLKEPWKGLDSVHILILSLMLTEQIIISACFMLLFT